MEKSIDAKLQLVKFTHGQTTNAIEKENLSSLERLTNTLKKKVEEIHDLKVTVQELKFEEGTEATDVLKWSTNLEHRVGEFEKAVVDLEKTMKAFKSTETQATKQE